MLSYPRMSFQGKRVMAFESRRAAEIAQLIRLNGGEPIVAPSMREVPIERNEAAFSFAEKLFRHEFQAVVLLTGVGTRYLAKVLATRYPEDGFPTALRSLTTVVRGPKPAAVLREWNVQIDLFAKEPNTWREVLAVMEGRPERQIALQEYGRPTPELVAGLQERGATVTTVPVYQWELPEDTHPLRAAVHQLARQQADVVLFTTGVQVQHLLQIAVEEGVEAEVRQALHVIPIASIGPTCTEALEENGFRPKMEPSHPKMGILVREAALQL